MKGKDWRLCDYCYHGFCIGRNANGPLCTRSRNWICPHCQQTNLELLPDPPSREEEDQKKWGPGNILGSQVTAGDSSATSTQSTNGSQVTDSSTQSTTEAEHVSSTTTEATFFETREQEPRQSSKKPHILLDTAICILLVLLFAIICRRIV